MERPPIHLLLSERESAEFRRSRRHRRLATAAALVVLAGLIAGIGPPLFRHLDAVAHFGMAGAAVDWQLDATNWWRGGATRLEFPGTEQVLNDAGLGRLRDLFHVKAVDLAGCDTVTENGLAVLADLHELEELDLSRARHGRPTFLDERPVTRLTDKSLVPLQNLTRLTNLSLAGNLITDDGLARLAGLTNLESLDLQGTRVTDAGLVHLKGMKRLKSLNLSETRVTRKGIQQLEATFGAIEDLVVDDRLKVQDEAANEDPSP